MRTIGFSIRNPLIVNLLLVVVALLGVFAWQSMPQEMFPVVNLDMVRIVTEFEGAPPEEVERQVTIPIEEAVDGLADIDVIQSTSTEGNSRVIITLKSGTDVDDFMRDVRTAVDAITDLPDEAEQPEIARLKTRFPVISLSLYGDSQPGYLYELAREVKRRLQQLPGVASVGVAGDREWELWVVLDPQVLAARGVPINLVARALRDNLRDLPGGSLKAREGDIVLRGLGTSPDPHNIERIALRTDEQGGELLLGTVGRVQLQLEEARTLGRFNGKPSVNLTVTKTVQASTIAVSEDVHEFAARLREELPANVQIGLFSDMSVYVRNRLDTVKSSGAVGLVLVLLSLYLFLNFRVALITALGIPVSFMVAVVIIHNLGYTINMVSLFAFLIALGMIVDDAIIVTENVYRHLEQGDAPALAAERGAREVYWPVVASTATTVAAFLPMFAIGGTLGEFIKVIPVVVTASLLGSLLEAFIVLPSHAAEMLRVRPGRRGRVNWKRWLDRYLRALRWALLNRYLVALVTVGVLAVAVTWAATRIPFQLFGQVEIGQFFVNIETPNTYSLEDSTALAVKVEGLIEEALDNGELKSLLTNVGVTLIDFNRVKFGSNQIQILVDLEKQSPEGFIERFVSPLINLRLGAEGSRERETDTIINNIRDRLQELSGIRRISILRPQGGPAGPDIEIGVGGPDTKRLLVLAEQISGYLKRLPGVHDVREDLDIGKLEYRYSLNERGRELGLTQAQIADAVRSGFLGLEVMHVNWGQSRYPVRVIFPEAVRRDSAALVHLPVTLEDGRTVYLGDVADLRLDRGLSTVQRRDRQRLATVTAEVDSDITTPGEVTELVKLEFADLERDNPGYGMKFLGKKKETAESMTDGARALVIALAVIFIILAALFKSLLDPIVVMVSIPFGAIGVIVGHVLFGYHLQFLSMVGFIALTGIVVNDSLILVDFARRLRLQGVDRMEAVLEAGRVRIRPILLTTVTTFLGISPLIFFATGQTAFLSPMAVSLGFGLVFATVLILIVLPSFYLIADDLRVRLRGAFGADTAGGTRHIAGQG